MTSDLHTQESKQASRPKILLVDDAQDYRAFTQTCLKRHGYFDFWEARSAREAIEFLGFETFDLIICDFYMESDTGLDVLNFLQAKRSAIPFVFLTSSIESIPLRLIAEVRTFSKWRFSPLVDHVKELGLA